MNKKVMKRFTTLLLGCVLVAGLASAVQARDLPEFTQLAERNSPAVVNISTQQKSKVQRALPKGFSMPDVPEGSPFSDLFKHFFGEGMDEFADRESQSLGSGFVISPDGYILTNYHVVGDADAIQVHFSDRRTYDAKVIGSDKGSDIALIKIEAKDLPTVKLGKSSDLKVGEWVLAIGSPFGFDHTVTAGIVSAKGRSLPSENYVPFIQTDVAINPGNSGGPLINLDGEVVGINSQIYSRTGGFMGLSFAIPIELAVNVADQLRDSGRVARGYLGVLIQDVDRNLAESFGMAQPHGALVSRVMPDSPADQAGLKVGDVILEFNGKPLLNSSQLPPMVGTARVEEKATLLLLRGGKEKEVAITVGRLPDDEEEASALPAIAQPDDIAQLGLSVIDIEPQVRKELGLDETGGALVSKVSPGAAQEAGINRGDIVLMFDGVDVKNAKHLRELIDQAGDKRTVAVLIHRGDSPLFLALRLKD
ncbi:MAG: DegQ family serine endoprotease [Gammaproteobacteria bacterium]|nr:DegQ family serine endoprotease [Gammaproteobacteria bacterium]MCP5316855.1 DegQ family serine endoprotease [Chromatiaceae bacterium]MCW5585105.1 DegQ family serine endoprotease [Chromatiales bacterium]MCB1816564.1 DegQ family serine endoprotease [Gammaproteobacteria bacterium]MCP5428866.1 DegQ family serine endoprotease [Chromatiaceae bacterium]